MFKKEKGITLVALVVTIIILLILAGVTLSLALNDTGIFRRAQNATERYSSSAENETQQLNTFYEYADNLLKTYEK